MPFPGRLMLWLLGCAAFGFDLNVSVSKLQLYQGEPVQLIYQFAYRPDDQMVDFRFAAPELAHFRMLDAKVVTSQSGVSSLWEKRYVVVPLQVGPVVTGKATINVAKRSYQKDTWGEWMPSTQWKRHDFPSRTLFVNPVPPAVMAVGDFELNASVDRTTVPAGKPVRLRFEVRGCGDISMSEPFQITMRNVSLFAQPRSVHGAWAERCYHSEANQTLTLVGGHDFMIPSVALRIFNPERGSIVIRRTEPIRIHVIAAPPPKEPIDEHEVEAVSWGAVALATAVGMGLGVMLTLLWLRRPRREKRGRTDSMRAMLLALFAHLDDPEARRGAEAMECHLYEGGPPPDSKVIASILDRLRRR